MSASFSPNFDQLQQAEFFAELSYKSPEERRTLLESSPYGEEYFIEEQIQSDEFFALVSFDKEEAFHVYRGSVNRSDFMTDVHLAVGKLKDTDRYKENSILSQQVIDKYGGFSGNITHIGHSLGGTIADQIGREKGHKSISFNQGSTPLHNYGESNATHQQVRIDNDFVSSFTKGPTISISHKPNAVESFLQKRGKFGQAGELARASRIVSSITSHFTSNFRTSLKQENLFTASK